MKYITVFFVLAYVLICLAAGIILVELRHPWWAAIPFIMCTSISFKIRG